MAYDNKLKGINIEWIKIMGNWIKYVYFQVNS